MSRAELKLSVTCIFWRCEDRWRGECVELAAYAAGRDLNETQGKLIAECYRVGAEALDRGQVPSRHPNELSEEARHHLQAVREHGASVQIDDTCEVPFRHVLREFDIALQRTVPELDQNVDLGMLRFVFIPSGKLWIAQCLDYDVGGEGSSPKAAAEAAVEGIMAHIAMDHLLGRPPLANVRQAPERYQRLYAAGQPIDIEKQDIEGRVAQAA